MEQLNLTSPVVLKISATIMKRMPENNAQSSTLQNKNTNPVKCNVLFGLPNEDEEAFNTLSANQGLIIGS
jgi:hypothetical protein